MKNSTFSAPQFLSSVLAAALFLSAAASASAQEVKFTERKARVGDVTESSSKMEMTADIAVKMEGQQVGVQKMARKQSDSKTMTVLVVTDGETTKLKVQFGEDVATDATPDGGTRETRSPLSGKTFIVEKQGDRTVVTDEKGAAVDEKLEKKVQGEYKELGKPDPMAKWLNGKTFKVGEKVEAPKEVTERMKDESLKIASLHFVVKGTRVVDGMNCAVLDATLKMSGEPEPGMEMTIEASGEMLVSIEHCEPISVKLKGPLQFKGEVKQEGLGFQLDGTGETTLEFITKLPK